ncbi:MAG TPA: DUF1326 domain-containing protein [Pyrinomonadaceae bacterium]|jgi:hypothetical protein|nr:DUF1326 domain-containing protein [Pyrinomonadaceae bacterium]
MRKFCLLGLLCLLAGALTFGAQAARPNLTGDYVEVRTASVFAGACHYNGELVTTGRDAVLAWRVTAGAWQGVDLAGVRALAVVSSEANLADATAARRAEVVVDSAASAAQADAIVSALRSKYAATFGHVLVVRRAPVSFAREAEAYSVSVPNVAELTVRAMPDHECCKLPHLVWYDSLVPLAGRRVGLTLKASFAGDTVGESWQQAGQNSAFYGNFAL